VYIKAVFMTKSEVIYMAAFLSIQKTNLS